MQSTAEKIETLMWMVKEEVNEHVTERGGEMSVDTCMHKKNTANQHEVLRELDTIYQF